jgi:hypothetical protein
MAKTLLWVFGVVFLLVGVLGFVPNPLVGQEGALFETDAMHNIVHLVFGAVLIVVALMAAESAGVTLIVVGVIYAVLAVLGFIMVPDDGMLLGLVHVNMADHWLHVLLAVVLIGGGYLARDGSSSMPMQSTM